MVTAPLDRYLTGGDEAAYLDLRVALVLLAVHEGFSGFIMTGEAADFMAVGHGAAPARDLRRPATWSTTRNEFVREMAKEMSYWAAWPMLAPGRLPPLEPPESPELPRACSTRSARCRSALGRTPSTPSVT